MGAKRLSISLRGAHPDRARDAHRVADFSTGCNVAGSTISRYSSFSIGLRNRCRGCLLIAAALRSPLVILRWHRSARETGRPPAAVRSALRWRLRELIARPSASRTVGNLDDIHRQIEVSDEPPDDRELLRVLLAEIRAVRLDHVEELQHDGRDATEMSWSKLPHRWSARRPTSTLHSGGWDTPQPPTAQTPRRRQARCTTPRRRRACADSARDRPGC